MGGTWQGVGGAPGSRGSMVSQLPSGMLHLNREEEDGVHGVEMPFELKAMEICLDEVSRGGKCGWSVRRSVDGVRGKSVCKV